MDRKEKLLELLKAKAIFNARDHFLPFMRMMAPLIIPEGFVEGKHIHLICEKLEEVEKGTIKRLQIWMPPRSSKSRLGSILFPAWVLGKHSNWDLMAVSYAKELAMEFSREVRNMVKSEEYNEIFPSLGLRPDSKAAYRWHTTGGGMYTAAGITSGVAGKGAHVAIIDDPLSEQDAISDAKRAFVHQWYPGGLRTRLSPDGKIVLITTRWSEDDLAGWLLKKQEQEEGADQWEVLEIPGLIENEKHKKLLGYELDTSYWPERWTTENLKKTRDNMPTHQWNALYQQHPSSLEGNILKRHWFKQWPYALPPNCEYIIQSYDTAFSIRDRADYTVIQTWGIWYLPEEMEKGEEILAPQMILLHSHRERHEFAELREVAKLLYKEYKPDCILMEKKASGQSLIQELRLAGLPVVEKDPDKDKVARAYAVQPSLEGGTIWVPKLRKWVDNFLDECSSFPYGAHDDQVDAFTQAVGWMRGSYKLARIGDQFYGWRDQRQKKRPTYWT